MSAAASSSASSNASVPRLAPHHLFKFNLTYDDLTPLSEFTLDELADGLVDRLHAYRFALGQMKWHQLPDSARRLVELASAVAIRNDMLSYRSTLIFLCNRTQSLRQPNEHRSGVLVWLRAEQALLQHRFKIWLLADRLEVHLRHFLPDLKWVSSVEIKDSDEAHPVPYQVLRVPFEDATSLVATRQCLLHLGFAYFDLAVGLSVLKDKATTQHQVNREECATQSLRGSLDECFADERICHIYASWKVQYRAVIQKANGLQMVAGAAAPVADIEDLRSIIKCAPECMSRLITKSLFGAAREHSRFPERRDFYQYMLRMKAPRTIVHDLVVKKVKVAYEATEVKQKLYGIEQEMKFEEKRFDHPRDKLFVPPCSWIINGSSKTNTKSDIVCPHAQAIKDVCKGNSRIDWTKAIFKEKLEKRAKAACLATWGGSAEMFTSMHGYLKSPDQFTQTGMDHQASSHSKADSSKRKQVDG